MLKWLVDQADLLGALASVLAIGGFLWGAVVLLRKASAWFAGLAAREVQKAQARWINATRYVAQHRRELAQLGLAHHIRDAEIADFPLVAKERWLLPEPFEMTADDKLTTLAQAPTVAPPNLADLDKPYHLVKLSDSPDTPQHNGIIYRLLDADFEAATPRFSVARCDYFTYLDSLEALAAELADHRLRCGSSVPKKLPLRDRLGDVAIFHNRCAAMGINCVLITKNYRGPNSTPTDVFWLHRRGEATLEAKNCIHVVPSGTFAPDAEGDGFPERDCSIWRTATRELLEELFGQAEVASAITDGTDFTLAPFAKPIIDLFRARRRARMFLLGFGLDPVTTKPEFLVAMVLDWQALTASTGENPRVQSNFEGTAYPVEWTQARLREASDDPRNLPACSAALKQTLTHFKTLDEAI